VCPLYSLYVLSCSLSTSKLLFIVPQIPLRSIMERMPWGPVRVSEMRDRMATHTMGDTSRPLKGLTTLRVAARSGSVRFGEEGRGSTEKSG
jgi:hypothetical protein